MMLMRAKPWQKPEAGGKHAYLVRAQITGHAKSYVIGLILELEGGDTQVVPVLVSSKGRVLELIKTPSAVIAMQLERLAGGGQVQSLHYRRLLSMEYRLRQFYRIACIFSKYPAWRRVQAGLTFKTLLFRLDKAYGIANRFRVSHTGNYEQWNKDFYTLDESDRRAIGRHIALWRVAPRFRVVILTGNDDQSSRELTRKSLERQIYPYFDVLEIPSSQWSCAWAAEQSVEAAADQGIWYVTLRAGTQLIEQALYYLANTARNHSDASIIYADHDFVTKHGGLQDPIFKPDWSPELLRSTNYIGEAFAWNSQHAVSLYAVPVASNYADAVHSMLLILTASAVPVMHVPAPLWHIPVDGLQTGDISEVVAEHLLLLRISAEVEATGPGTCRVKYPVRQPSPLVSIIIPTRDGLDHLQRCIASILEKTQYRPFEILIVDNQSIDPRTIAYLDSLRLMPQIRVLPFKQPFNYSKINNMAVNQANGELVCLLNNDTEVISPDWLEEMAGLLLRDDIGVVGAKLLFDDGTVQHAGDTVGPGGCANHLHSGISVDAPGYAGRALVAQDLSAVTAACLLTKKSLYQQLGGLNEVNLIVAFNDVDYCLRVREAGLRVVWTPHALLYHHESVTRGKDETPAQLRRARKEIRYMRKRWAHVMQHDPFYNPNLNYRHADFALSTIPSISKPWINP